MKKFFYLLPAMALVFTVSSCSDDDDKIDEIKVKASSIQNAPAAGEIDAVQFVTYSPTGGRTVLKSSAWDNGFTLALPETVSSTHLYSVADIFDLDDSEAMTHFTVSDMTAKVCTADIEGAKNNVYVDKDFYVYKGTSSDYYIVEYYYSDKKVSIKGSYEDEDGDTYKINITLNRGWTEVAYRYWSNAGNYHEEYTSSIPSGMSWRFGDR